MHGPYTRLIVAVVATLGTAAPASAAVTPRLEEALRSARAGQHVAVVATLRDQPVVAAPPAASPAARVRTIVTRLRDAASLSQTSILRALAGLARDGRVDRVEPLWITDAIALRGDAAAVRELAARRDVALVDLDVADVRPADTGTTTTTSEANVALTNAPALWDAGFTGQGAVVASLDTGVDVSHPDLAASWRGGSNSWFDPNGEHPATPTDVSGHGTQTMGVIAGGAAGGSAIGMAPGARWIAAKIFNDRGVATTSGIHKSFQWVLDPDGNPATADAATVVNNSWTANSAGCDLTYEPDLRSLRAAGIVPVFAAGNLGPGSATDTSPGNNPDAFAVGATDVFDQIASFSSRGPSGCGEPGPAIFPELVAPGVSIRTADLYQDWIRVTGTSMAAPHAAGALALLASAYPGAAADRQASALEAGAIDLGAAGADNDVGYGRLDVARALEWLRTAPDFSVDAAPASVSTVAGGTVAYTINVRPINGFTADVALSVSGLDPSQATMTMSPSVVAGGNGSAQLTVKTATALAPGTYPLSVTATSGSLKRTATVGLQVSGPPDFTLDATPPSATVSLGGTASFTISAPVQNGFTGNITLSVSGLPYGAKASFSVNPFKAGGSSVMKVATTTGTRRGTFALTVTGTSAALVRRARATLTVR
ncbi:MAG TPA: S8 family serine peptidase [Thermoleophilaceae bacterium]|nr:S8 family serine peptidase [Thermoleophilaceae bacterium]